MTEENRRRLLRLANAYAVAKNAADDGEPCDTSGAFGYLMDFCDEYAAERAKDALATYYESTRK